MGSISSYVGSLPPSSSIPAQMPVISRGLPSTGTALNNSTYHDQLAQSAPATFAINLNSVSAASKTTVLLVWFNQTRPVINPAGPWYGVPRNFTLEKHTSSSGTEPASGWTTLATITDNTDTCRIHYPLNLSDAGWFRMNVSTERGGSGTQIQMDLHDIANGTDDSLAITGDSNPMQAYNGQSLVPGAYSGGSLETLIESATGRSAPLIINYAVGGSTSDSLNGGSDAAHFAAAIASPCKYVMVQGGGSNDASNAGFAFTSGSATATTFKTNMQAMITAVQNAGKVAILPTLPWQNANAWVAPNAAILNAKIAELLVSNPTAIAGPDLWSLSNLQNSLIDDGRHFTYDSSTQAVTTSAVASLGLPTGLTGYEAVLRLTRDVMVNEIYT